ncbi:hypothetical protein H0H87_002026 [Tephrocybe sp. NHM501043]|nr:hypothetical protein H0H87_002026 [Tephrocybe sp. NHM501043]
MGDLSLKKMTSTLPGISRSEYQTPKTEAVEAIVSIKNSSRRCVLTSSFFVGLMFIKYHEDPKEFAWVARHSWQSWRNRLNKNVDRFMPMIDRYVESEEPGPKQAYELRRKRHFLDENNDEVFVEQPGSSFKRRRDNLSPAPSAIRSPLSTAKGKEKAVAEEEQQLDNGHYR